jgi:prevent-host-death family protein
MGRIVNIHFAKTHLSELAAEVEAGGAVIIARRGKPVMKLVRIEEPVKPITPGFAKHLFVGWEDYDWEEGKAAVAAMFDAAVSTLDPLDEAFERQVDKA